MIRLNEGEGWIEKGLTKQRRRLGEVRFGKIKEKIGWSRV